MPVPRIVFDQSALVAATQSTIVTKFQRANDKERDEMLAPASPGPFAWGLGAERDLRSQAENEVF